MKDMFYYIGIISTMCLGASIVTTLYFFTREVIEGFLYRRAYKNRFEAKPIASCYCVDCRKWNPETGECSDQCNSRTMADCWFCCFADPLTKEELDRRNEKRSRSNGKRG